MSAIHQFKCDSCGEIGDSKYHGEQWLAPEGWFKLSDASTGYYKGDICKKCDPRKKISSMSDVAKQIKEVQLHCSHPDTTIWEPHLAGARKCLSCGRVKHFASSSVWVYEEKAP